MKSYNEIIKDTRIDRDLNQTQIAIVLKTSQTYYSQYEKGKRKMPIEHLITLCKFYNLSADYLLGLSEEPRPLKK